MLLILHNLSTWNTVGIPETFTQREKWKSEVEGGLAHQVQAVQHMGSCVHTHNPPSQMCLITSIPGNKSLLPTSNSTLSLYRQEN